jgi:hypothetical protein
LAAEVINVVGMNENLYEIEEVTRIHREELLAQARMSRELKRKRVNAPSETSTKPQMLLLSVSIMVAGVIAFAMLAGDAFAR